MWEKLQSHHYVLLNVNVMNVGRSSKYNHGLQVVEEVAFYIKPKQRWVNI